MLVEMRVKGLAVDEASNTPIVVLGAEDEDDELYIAIGLFEASAIALKLEDVQVPRPLTHDLLCATIKSLGAEVMYVEVTELRNITYHACLVL